MNYKYYKDVEDDFWMVGYNKIWILDDHYWKLTSLTGSVIDNLKLINVFNKPLIEITEEEMFIELL